MYHKEMCLCAGLIYLILLSGRERGCKINNEIKSQSVIKSNEKPE